MSLTQARLGMMSLTQARLGQEEVQINLKKMSLNAASLRCHSAKGQQLGLQGVSEGVSQVIDLVSSQGQSYCAKPEDLLPGS